MGLGIRDEDCEFLGFVHLDPLAFTQGAIGSWQGLPPHSDTTLRGHHRDTEQISWEPVPLAGFMRQNPWVGWITGLGSVARAGEIHDGTGAHGDDDY